VRHVSVAPGCTQRVTLRMNHTHRGFTLVEILVVIIIITILTSFVTLNLNIRNVSKSIQTESRRIGALMQLASDEAVYSRQQLGIRFHPEAYEFYVLAPLEEGLDPSWQIMSDDKLTMRTPAEPLLFDVEIEGIPIILETLEDERKAVTEQEPIKPHILFLSNGEVMPDFRIVVSDVDEEYRHLVYSGEEAPFVVEVLE